MKIIDEEMGRSEEEEDGPAYFTLSLLARPTFSFPPTDEMYQRHPVALTSSACPHISYVPDFF